MVSLVIIALMFVSSQAFCPILLPQDEPWWSPCKGLRGLGLLVKRGIFRIKEATPEMPYNRLDMNVAQYLLFLATNPFLAAHSTLWVGQGAVVMSAQAVYTAGHLLSNPIMTLEDYASMRKFFRNHISSPLNLIRGYMKIASDYEPFQSDYTQWIADHFFAEQRVAGLNPHTLRKVTFSNSVGMNYVNLKKKLNPKFNLVEAVNRVLGGVTDEASLKKAVEDGRLFVLYHPLSSNAPTMPDLTDKDPKRTMWTYMSPMAILASKAGKTSKRKLTPVAIQMDDNPEAKVFTPQDGDSWMLAKLNMQLTDLACSQVVEHLSKVHFVVEAVCLSLERQLSKLHPLYDIMRFHCRGIFTANTLGGSVLLDEGKPLHQIIPFGYKGSNYLMRLAAGIIDWNDLDLSNNLKRRGVDDEANLPFFPYRDDGKVILKVLEAFVTDYVNSFYSSDDRVAKDKEVQSFAREISAAGTGKIKGFPASFPTKASLIETFTRFLWVLVGHHTSVNYPQSDYASYVPNLSTKLYDDTRVPNDKFTTARLNNRKTSGDQEFLIMSLSSFRFDRLFDYGSSLGTSKGKHVVNYFHNKLAVDIEPVLKKRNEVRKQQGDLTYPYLQPKWLTNGIQA